MSHPASMHDSYGFLNAFFKTKKFLLDFHAEKFLLDYAHNTLLSVLELNRITTFIVLNGKRGIRKNKDNFAIGKDGIPICKTYRKMNHDGVEIINARIKFCYPLISHKYDCSCDFPCFAFKIRKDCSSYHER